MADFLNKVAFIQDVSEYDRNILGYLDTQEEIEKRGNVIAQTARRIIGVTGRTSQ
ncbi:MAG: hypothetical protein V8S08_05070 [Lachnoclostridium sp.]